jgi:hypothetical protein
MATNVFTLYSDSLKGSFDSAYVGRCLQAASKESLTLTDSISEYHYTLYYYDQAGNLVKTVPPAGLAGQRKGGKDKRNHAHPGPYAGDRLPLQYTEHRNSADDPGCGKDQLLVRPAGPAGAEPERKAAGRREQLQLYAL